MKKILVSIFMVILILISGFLAYLVLTTPKAKVFEKKGVTVELTSDFKEVKTEKWDFYVENAEYAFMSNRFSKKSTFETPNGVELELSTLTLQSYLSLILAAYGLSSDESQANATTIYYVDTYGSGFYYCYYKDAEAKYAYMLLVKESLNYFYTVNIACDADDLNDSRAQMLQYAVTVTVD